jgi:pectate lyase
VTAAVPKATLQSNLVQSLFQYREGFGAGTTGGLNGDVYTVTNLNDSGPGSLRFAAEDRSSKPIWIVFDPSLQGGTITLNSTIYLGANRTIDGRGSNITITDHGITIGGNWGASNDIITGLTIRDVSNSSEDNITIYGVNNIWVHHVSLSGQNSDGLLDISAGTKNVTVDWSRFSDHNGAMMINSYSTSPDPKNSNSEILNGHQLDNYERDKDTHVTLHHNVFDGTIQREPRVVFGEVHMYNNLLKDWGSYAIGASFRAEVLVEGNIFDSDDQYGSRAIVTQVGIDPEPGFVRATNNLFLGTASGGSSGAEKVFTPSYQYQYEAPTVSLEARLLREAGAGGSSTLNLLALETDEQIAATYVAFFGRGADAAGLDFWVNQFDVGKATQRPAALFANIASSFGISNEAKALYPFLVNPFSASDSAVTSFIDTVYDNLFNRASDAGGLAYWAAQTKATLQAGKFVGSILINIISGAQDTAATKDIATLMSKVAVSLHYVEAQKEYHSIWSGDDLAEARALIHGVTNVAATVLVGIAQADWLVSADAA